LNRSSQGIPSDLRGADVLSQQGQIAPRFFAAKFFQKIYWEVSKGHCSAKFRRGTAGKHAILLADN
jgi:hypothetical protein